MKLLAAADHHFVEGPRWEECLRVHEWIAERVEVERPAVFLSAGDLYDRASTPRERAAVAAWLQRIARVCPVVVTKGNHDRPLDLELLGRLESAHPIIIEERAGVHYVGELAIGCVAWPNRATLAAALGQPLDGVALDDAAREALRAVLLEIRHQWESWPGPKVLLGHFMVDGSVTSTGQPLIGSELNVGLADLALAGADIVIMGHIHAPQDWSIAGVPVVYTGSPFRTAFGETEQKSILSVEWPMGTATGARSWERIPTPARQMILAEDEWGRTWDASELGPDDVAPMGWRVGWHGLDTLEVPGAEIRLRYQVASDQREAARAAAERERETLFAEGAHSVKIEERVIATTRARVPEIATATTLADKLDALWRSRRDLPAPERIPRLLAKLDQLEEESHAA